MSEDHKDPYGYLIEATPPMLEAIGRVACAAANFEERLHMAYWRYAKLSSEIGSIITETLKPKRLFQDLIKIVRETQSNPHIVADIEDISSIYGGVSEQRNEIIHWIWNSYPGYGSGEHRAFAPDQMRSKRGKRRDYTVEDVNRIAARLCQLFNRIVPHAMTEQELRSCREGAGEKANQHFPAPWLDKPWSPSPKPSETPDAQK